MFLPSYKLDALTYALHAYVRYAYVCPGQTDDMLNHLVLLPCIPHWLPSPLPRSAFPIPKQLIQSLPLNYLPY